MYSQKSYKFFLRKNLYPNLLFNIFPHIAEKYHQYLRLVSPSWKAVSQRLILPLVADVELEYERLNGIVLNQKRLHLGKICLSPPQAEFILGRGCYLGNKILIKFAIENGASDFHWGLYDAGYGNYPEIIKLMIALGTTNFNAGMFGACANGNLEMVRLMIEKEKEQNKDEKRNPDFNWDDLLENACAGGNMDVVKLIIEYGGSSLNWDTAFVSACRSHPICPYPVLSDANRTQFSMKEICRSEQLEIVDLMLKNGATDIWNGFKEACFYRQVEIVRYLMEKYPDECLNFMPLFNASKGGSMEIVKMIIYSKDEIYETGWNEGLNGASQGGSLEIAKLMVDSGATNLDYGLDLACHFGHLEIVKLLLSRGATVKSYRFQETDTYYPPLIKEYLLKNWKKRIV